MTLKISQNMIGTLGPFTGDLVPAGSDTSTTIQLLINAINTKEPTLPTGSGGQYIKGDKTVATLDKAAVGLSDVDNTSDLNKPISNAVTTALAGKEPSLPNGGNSTHYLRGDKIWVNLDKSAIGLSSVDNTSDADKPISNAVQLALLNKASTVVVTTTVNGLMAFSDKVKLDGIATGATANSTDAQLRDRDTHSGVQAISTVNGLQLALDAKAPLISPPLTGTPTINGHEIETRLSKGASNGYAPLGADGKVPSINLPDNGSYKGNWDASTNTPEILAGLGTNGDTYTVSEAGTQSVTGSPIAFSVGDQLRFTTNGNKWERIPNTQAVSSVAGLTGTIGSGDLKTALSLSKGDVGLGSVDNTADLDKPISLLVSAALSGKQASLVSGTSIKTIAGLSVLGSGDLGIIPIAYGGTGASTQSTARSNLGLGSSATVNTGTSGSVIPLLSGSNTWSSGQTFQASTTISNPSSSSILNITSVDGQQSYVTFRTANVEMWRAGKNQTANTGSNAGSNFALIRYDDAGTSLGTAIFITRSNGDVSIGGKLQPATTNAYALGSTTNQWLNLFSATVTTANAQITGGSITGITDLAIADGGTGSSTASGARSNLGLGNVDNTSDVNKPVSTAQAAAIEEVYLKVRTVEWSEVVSVASKSVFTLPFTPILTAAVYRSGVRLMSTSYSISGTTLTLNTPALLDDEIILVAGEQAIQASVALANVIGLSSALSLKLDKTSPVTFSNLPASPQIGERAFVSDSTTETFRASVTVGGGALVVPVHYTASGWKVG